MSAEQRHEIYDNDGTLIGYESAQADPVTGQFNRYDEANTLCGFAKDSGDVIYHYDKSMRFIGFARLEDGVLREYDRQSNVVGYQARQMADAEDMASPVQGYADFSQPTNAAGSAHPAAPSPSIYATPKTYAFSGNSWLGNRFTNDAEDATTPDANHASDTSGDEPTFGTPSTSFDYKPAGSRRADHPSPTRPFNTAFNEPPNAFRNNPRYEEIVGDDGKDPNPDPGSRGQHPEVGSRMMGHHSAQSQPTSGESPNYDDPYNNAWQPPPQRATNPNNGYAMRGEIVDDVDENGNEIDPNSDKPFWENMPPGATPPPPLAKPSPFASKPSLLQRLLARVMPFLSGKSANPTNTSAPARNTAAALPAPNRSPDHSLESPYPNNPNYPKSTNTGNDHQAHNTEAQTTPPNAPQSKQIQQFGQTQPRNEEVIEDDENFDPFAEFRIVIQKIRFYTDRFFPKRKAQSQHGMDSLDSRDAAVGQMDQQDNDSQHADYGAAAPAFSNSMFGAGHTQNGFAGSQAVGFEGASVAANPGMGLGLPDMLAYLATAPAYLAQAPRLVLASAVKAVQTPVWLWWMTATTLGAIAFGMLRLFIPPISDIPAGVYGGVYGLTMGISQWAMLRHRYRTTWQWVLLSVCASIAGTVLWGGEQTWLQAHGNGVALGEMLLLSCVMSAAQWLLLRNLSSRAAYWLLLTPVAGLLGWIGYQVGSIAGYMGALTAHGLALGAVSGLALVHTLEDTSRTGLLRTPRNSSVLVTITMLSGGIRAISAAIALGGLLEAISGSLGSAMHGLPTQQTPLLLALLSVYPARLFVSLASMGSALGYKQNESGQSRAWLVGASIAGIVIEIVAQIVLPESVRPGGSGWFILSNLVVLVLIDILTPLPAAEEAPTHTTLTSLSAIGILSGGLLIFFASVFTAVHAINIDLMATASLTADALGFSLSLGTLVSIVRVVLSAFAIFVALRLPGERSNGWAEVPMGVLAIAIATFGPMLIDSSAAPAAGSADQQWLAPILLCGTALGFGLLRNAPAFGGALPKANPDAERAKRRAPRLLPIAVLIVLLSIGVMLSRNGMLTSLTHDPRVGGWVGKAQSLGSNVTSQVGQVKLPKSMSEVQQSTAGLQQTVSDLLQKIQPTPEPTADWPPASQKSK